MKRKFTLPFILLAFMTGGCQTGSFQEGDERTYQVVTSTKVELKSYYDNIIVQDTVASMRYQITKTGNHLGFDIYNDYFKLKSNNGFEFSSDDVDGSLIELRRLMSAGFEATIDQKSGQLETFKAKNDALWQAVSERSKGLDLTKQLQQSIPAPIITQRIKAKAGYSVVLNEIQGQKVTLVVDEVTNRKLKAHFETNEDNSNKHLYGRLILDRKSGWIDRMVAVLKQPYDSDDASGTLSSLMLIGPENEPLDFYSLNNDNHVYTETFSEIPSEMPVFKTVSPKEVFSLPVGIFTPESKEVSYLLPSLTYFTPADVELTELTAIDAQGKPLDMVFWPESYEAIPNIKPGFIEKTYSLRPKGWSSDLNYQAVHSIQANARYTPVKSAHQTIKWQDKPVQTFDIDDMHITITADPNQLNKYHVHTVIPRGCEFFVTFDGLKGMFRYELETQSAWASPEQRRILDEFDGTKPVNISVQLEKTPEKATFHYTQKQTTEIHEQKLSFKPIKGYQPKENKPPFREATLFPADDEQKQDGISEFDIDQIEPDTLTGQSFGITLPYDWAAACKTSIVQGFTENGHELVLQALSDEELQSNGQMSKLTFPILETVVMHDPFSISQYYFYDKSATISLNCPGHISWQDIPFQPTRKNQWRIPLAVLPDDVPLSMPVKQFLSTYRFINEQGEPLTLLNATEEDFADLNTETIGDILAPGNLLQVSGIPVKIQHVITDDKPVERVWQIDFPPLPDKLGTPKGIITEKTEDTEIKRTGQWNEVSRFGFLKGVSNYDNQGRKQGRAYRFSFVGALASIEEYKDDQLEGISVGLHKGKVQIKIYKNGQYVQEENIDEYIASGCDEWDVLCIYQAYKKL